MLLGAGPFQSLIFADSICSLATAAPLVYITKPWHYASWKLVVTLLLFQVPSSLYLSAAACWQSSFGPICQHSLQLHFAVQCPTARPGNSDKILPAAISASLHTC